MKTDHKQCEYVTLDIYAYCWFFLKVKISLARRSLSENYGLNDNSEKNDLVYKR